MRCGIALLVNRDSTNTLCSRCRSTYLGTLESWHNVSQYVSSYLLPPSAEKSRDPCSRRKGRSDVLHSAKLLLLSTVPKSHCPSPSTRRPSPPWPRPHNRSETAIMVSMKNANGDGHFPQRLKNFFRLSSGNSKERGEKDRDLAAGVRSEKDTTGKSPFRQTRFFSVGRLRSTTVASEGNVLDENLSPTALANPYFTHQGQPGLRHHNDGSVPPSPPDTPVLKINGQDGAAASEHATTSTKEELARKLRKVASAPNVQGLFNRTKGSGERPATAELSKEPLVASKDTNTVGFAEAKLNGNAPGTLAVPTEIDGLGNLPSPMRAPLAFRRTYSSNSIKIRDVEVGPQSFDKIKLIGKGDVGKVYLVREKKSTRLYAMKGAMQPNDLKLVLKLLTTCSTEQKGDDQA